MRSPGISAWAAPSSSGGMAKSSKSPGRNRCAPVDYGLKFFPADHSDPTYSNHRTFLFYMRESRKYGPMALSTVLQDQGECLESRK
jgi:hypothetical protein